MYLARENCKFTLLYKLPSLMIRSNYVEKRLM